MKVFNKKNKKYFTFKGHQYAINFERLKFVCLSSSENGGTTENEVSYAYEVLENGNLNMTSKVDHETVVKGNPQNDMIIYDIVKLLILSLLDNNSTEKEFEETFGFTLALNSLLAWGVVEEITE